MAISVDFTVTREPWIENPRTRWNNGLLSGSGAWRAVNQKYPSQDPASTYRRTTTLADKAQASIVEMGIELDLFEVVYWRYVMFGTGLFGPFHRMIVPIRAKRLAWIATRGPMEGQYIRASAVSGFIWADRLDQIKDSLGQAFAAGIKQNSPDMGGV